MSGRARAEEQPSFRLSANGTTVRTHVDTRLRSPVRAGRHATEGPGIDQTVEGMVVAVVEIEGHDESLEVMGFEDLQNLHRESNVIGKCNNGVRHHKCLHPSTTMQLVLMNNNSSNLHDRPVSAGAAAAAAAQAAANLDNGNVTSESGGVNANDVQTTTTSTPSSDYPPSIKTPQRLPMA